MTKRCYCCLKIDKQYKRKIIWKVGGSTQNSLAVVEYMYMGKFPGLGPYGDGSSVNEYVRVPGHVIDEVKEMASANVKPSQILNKLKAKYDPIHCPPSLSNVRQTVYRQKVKNNKDVGHSSNIADQIQELENMVAEGQPFVRSITRNSPKSPCVILYTDSHISDIKTFCCSGQTVLGVDKTFMLCKMYVTVTCYKNLSVTRTRSGEPPVFLGPLFFHDYSD